MCRNIKLLFNFVPPVTNDDIRAASLQFVRKVNGFNNPSIAHEAAFLAAIELPDRHADKTHTAERYKARSQAERTNARLKDEFGGRQVQVIGPARVMNHLMFGLLALTADQLLRLLR